MDMPPVVSPEEWKTARERLLVKEKELTRARDAPAADRVYRTYFINGRGAARTLDVGRAAVVRAAAEADGLAAPRAHRRSAGTRP